MLLHQREELLEQRGRVQPHRLVALGQVLPEQRLVHAHQHLVKVGPAARRSDHVLLAVQVVQEEAAIVTTSRGRTAARSSSTPAGFSGADDDDDDDDDDRFCLCLCLVLGMMKEIVFVFVW